MTTNPSPSPAAGDPVDGKRSDTTDAVAPVSLVQRLAGEALGTFVLILLGAGATSFAFAQLTAADFNAGATGLGSPGVSPLAYALALAAAGYAFSRLSGGHFNPAVSIAAALSGRLAWKDAGLYAAAQVGGGLLAGLVLFVLAFGYDGADASRSMFLVGFGDDFTGVAWWSAILLEIVLTVLFVYLVLAVTDDRHEHRGVAPLAVGLAYGAVVFAGASATGGVANPARALATNVFGGVDSLLSGLVVLVATLIGAAVAGLTYPLLFGKDREAVAGSGLKLGGGSRRSRGNDQYAAWQQQQGGYYDQQQGAWQGQPGQQGGYYDQQQGAWQGQPGQQQGQQQGGGYYEQPQYGDQGGWQGQQPPQQGYQQPGYEQPGYEQQGQAGWGRPETPSDPYAAPQSPGDDEGHTRMRPDQP
jgi:aquaporin Z